MPKRERERDDDDDLTFSPSFDVRLLWARARVCVYVCMYVCVFVNSIVGTIETSTGA